MSKFGNKRTRRRPREFIQNTHTKTTHANSPATVKSPNGSDNTENVQQHLQNEKLTLISNRLNRATATKRLTRTLRTHYSRKPVIAKYMARVVTKYGDGMVFGKDSDTMRAMFNQFADFKYSSEPVKQLGQSSKNGAVYVVPFEKNGFKISALLKKSLQPESDNLVYEYLVGLFINKYTEQFPCFVETYACVHLSDKISTAFRNINKIPIIMRDIQPHLLLPPAYHKQSITGKPTPRSHQVESRLFEKGLQPDVPDITQYIDDNELFKFACYNETKIGLLTQYFNKSKTISNSSLPTIERGFLGILYQVYSALSHLKNKFTHYDLHHNNVLLVMLADGHCIKYVYHSAVDETATVEFYADHVCKIIDYGRCFFDAGHGQSSQAIKKKLCDTLICNTGSELCGDNSGFWSQPLPHLNIISTVRNHSADLLFAWVLSKITRQNTLFNNLPPNMNLFNTPELQPDVNSAQIRNVTDLHERVRQMMIQPTYMVDNFVQHKHHQCIGTLHVYESGTKPMKFDESIAGPV